MLEKKNQPSENFTSADHGALKAVSFCSQALKHNKVQPLTDIFKHVRYHYLCIFCILEKNKGLKMTLFTVIWLIADPPSGLFQTHCSSRGSQLVTETTQEVTWVKYSVL